MYTRQCLKCQIWFETNKQRKLYCTRKCFKRAYDAKKKAEAIEEEKLAESIHPSVTCEECENSYPLDFDPVKEWWKIEGNFCPFCFTPRRSGDPRTPEMIRVSFGFTGTFNSMVSHVFNFSFTS